MEKIKEPFLAYSFVVFLYITIGLSKIFPFFSNFVVVILMLPTFFYPLSFLGFKNIKKGFFIGIVASIPFFLFIKTESIKFLFFVNTVIFSTLEELFFRGYLFQTLPIKNIHIKNFAISLLFSIAHILFYGSLFKITVFFPSLIFGYLYIYTGSIVAPAIFHIFSNFFYESFLYDKFLSFFEKL